MGRKWRVGVVGKLNWGLVSELGGWTLVTQAKACGALLRLDPSLRSGQAREGARPDMSLGPLERKGYLGGRRRCQASR